MYTNVCHAKFDNFSKNTIKKKKVKKKIAKQKTKKQNNINNSKIDETFFQYSDLVTLCEILVHGSDFEPNFIGKSRFAEIQLF